MEDGKDPIRNQLGFSLVEITVVTFIGAMTVLMSSNLLKSQKLNKGRMESNVEFSNLIKQISVMTEDPEKCEALLKGSGYLRLSTNSSVQANAVTLKSLMQSGTTVAPTTVPMIKNNKLGDIDITRTSLIVKSPALFSNSGKSTYLSTIEIEGKNVKDKILKNKVFFDDSIKLNVVLDGGNQFVGCSSMRSDSGGINLPACAPGQILSTVDGSSITCKQVICPVGQVIAEVTADKTIICRPYADLAAQFLCNFTGSKVLKTMDGTGLSITCSPLYGTLGFKYLSSFSPTGPVPQWSTPQWSTCVGASATESWGTQSATITCIDPTTSKVSTQCSSNNGSTGPTVSISQGCHTGYYPPHDDYDYWREWY